MLVKFVHSELQSLGIEYLSSVLKRQGYQTALVIDPYFPFFKKFADFVRGAGNYKKSLLKRILSDRPDVIAFSVHSFNMEWAVDLALELKRQSSSSIVFGGIQATLVPEVFLNNDAADFVVQGEGEDAFLELVRRLEAKNGNFEIKNVWHKKGGELTKSPLRNLIEDLDVLPFPDKELWPAWLNGGAYRIITGRGCPGACSYCCSPIFKKLYSNKGRVIRRRSVSNVIDELKEVRSKYKIKRVLFEDDSFAYDKEWLKEFSGSYKKEIALPCFIHAAPETIDEEVILRLKQMPCYAVEIGVQSINQKTREKVLNRYYTNEKIVEVAQTLKANGINCICDNIAGLPEEDENNCMEMVDFYNRLRPGKIEVLTLEYYAKAEIVGRAAIPEQKAAEINNGKLVVSDGVSIGMSKMLLLLGLSYIIPAAVINIMLRKRLYRFLPYFRDFNHVNEAIFYLAALFKKKSAGAFIALRADIIYKYRYLFESIMNRA